ncbi:hypothetical protein ACWG8W_06045 [Citricoccus zhacaiensis]
MSNIGLVGYFDWLGYYHATQVRWDSHTLLEDVGARFETEGYDGLRAWIDAGIVGGGYVDVSHTESMDEPGKPYNPMAADGRASRVADYFDNFQTEAAVVVSRYGVRSLAEALFRREEGWRYLAEVEHELLDGEDGSLERGTELLRERLAHDPENRDKGIRQLVRYANNSLKQFVWNEESEFMDLVAPEGVTLYPSVDYPDGTTDEAEEQHWGELEVTGQVVRRERQEQLAQKFRERRDQERKEKRESSA